MHTHPSITWRDLEAVELSVFGPWQSESCSDIEDVPIAPPLSPQRLIARTSNADNFHVFVTTRRLPVPIDLFAGIGEHLNVQDWPHFFCTNRAINALYGRDQIGYAKSLRKIGSALHLPEIRQALTAIAQYTVAKQPYLLRALAQNIRMQTHGPAYGAIQQWKGRIDSHFAWHDAQPPSAERDLALQQLIIARGLAIAKRAFPKGEALDDVIGARLDRLSPTYWPTIFEAFLPNTGVRGLLMQCEFTEKFTGHTSVSPELAALIAYEFLHRPHGYVDVSTLLCARFGVSDACAREVVAPLLAEEIVKDTLMATQGLARNAWLMECAQQWRRDDHDFAALVTDTLLKSFDEKVYRDTSFSTLLRNDFSLLPELERKVRERTLSLESPTISALRDTTENDQEPIDAFLKLIDRIGMRPVKGDYTAVLTDIIAMPLVARPALLHRLVSNAQIGRNDKHTAQAFTNAALECLYALTAGLPQNGPLISRVSAALILVANASRGYDAPAADALVAHTSDLAFSRLTPEDWGDVLHAMVRNNADQALPADGKEYACIDERVAVFVRLPHTSVRHLPLVRWRLHRILGSVWSQLPDKAEGVHSRFAVFIKRMEINPRKVERELASIATSLVPNIVPGVHFLEDVATAAGFDEPDAIEALTTALFNLTIYPALDAYSDVDAITNQYTRRSLYLQALIDNTMDSLRSYFIANPNFRQG